MPHQSRTPGSNPAAVPYALKLARIMPFCPFSRDIASQTEGVQQQRKMPSLLEALTVKHPKTLNTGAAILTLFSKPSADSRSLNPRTLSFFLKTSADFRFLDPRTITVHPFCSRLIDSTRPCHVSHQTHSARNPAPDKEAELIFQQGRTLVPEKKTKKDYLQSRPQY